MNIYHIILGILGWTWELHLYINAIENIEILLVDEYAK